MRSASAASSAATASYDPVTLRVAFMPNLGSAATLYAAIDQGYFDEVGITVEPSQFDAGPAEIAAMQSAARSLIDKTITTGTSLYDATCVMEAEKIRRVIVVDDAGELAGVAALADLALAGKDEATAQVVKEVSEPGRA